MMSDVDPKILSRIRKLMALGTSPQPHEAALAMKKALELMRKHGLTETEVEQSVVEERLANSGRVGLRVPRWHGTLAVVIGEAFGLKPIWRPGGGFIHGGFVFVGLGASLDIGCYAYEVLLRKCRGARSAYLSSIRGKRSNRIRKADEYAFGWVIAVADEIKRFASPTPQVVVDYMAKRGKDLVAATPIDRGRDKDRRHINAGVADGSGVKLQNAVSEVERKQVEG